MIQKRSSPEKVALSWGKKNYVWQIRRHDGQLVGHYATKKLAQEVIDKSPWLL